MEHSFTPQITSLLTKAFGQAAEQIYEASPLLQYINIKTRSAGRGSKSRGSFANLYAIYVLVEDYIDQRVSRASRVQLLRGRYFLGVTQTSARASIRKQATEPCFESPHEPGVQKVLPYY